MKYGRYETLRELGRGSMGVVYEAHDPQIDRTVALKVLRQDRHASDAFVRRFLKEAKAIGRLSHPNIVTVYDVGEDHGTIYIAMEFLEGQPLNQVMEDRQFNFEEVLDLGIQIAETLDYAHSKGVVHRDIKPSNILVQPKGRIKITDFGIAHIEDPSATLQTQDGEILGTPAYMSPEQVLGKNIDGRSDLFSLGVILYELSTGTRPFGRQGKTLATLFNEITNATPPDPTELNSAADPRLSGVIMKCLSKDPRERYPSGEALANALRECQARETATVVFTPSRSTEQDAVPARRSRVWLPLILILMVTALAASLFHAYPGMLERVTDWLGKGGADHKPAGQMAVLKAESLPEGVELWVDGSPRGKTPIEIELDLGKHSLRAVAPGYEEWTEELVLSEPKIHPLQIQLKQRVALAFVKIESIPPGAMLSIDGVSEGKTPLGLELPLGEHDLLMSLKNHEDGRTRIRLSEEKEYSVSVELKPVPVVQKALLNVDTEPPGAEILLNGEHGGKSPTEIALPLGKYRVAVRLEGYVEWTEEMQLGEARAYPLKVRLEPEVKKATLRVITDPPGADVQVDGQSMGRTPASGDFPAGRRIVQISLDGYEAHSEEVSLDEPREYALDITLKRAAREGDLRIESVPAGAEVFLDGKPRGVTPFELKIPPGEHMVALKLQDHEDWQQRVRIEEGKVSPIRASLMPIARQSTLAVSSVPSKAEVYVDGVRKGKTPLKLQLPMDTYKVQVKLNSYQDWETRVEMRESREYSLKATLIREPAKQRASTDSREPAARSEPRSSRPPSSTGNDWGIGTYQDRRIDR
jgi:serine/threonine-protein kinase